MVALQLAGMIGILILLAWAIVYRTKEQRRTLEVGLKGNDEVTCIYCAAELAARMLPLGKGDKRLFYALTVLQTTRMSLPMFFYRIPKSELDILAPFIDLMIEGKGLSRNLPNEYKDWRPDVLTKFKRRMLDEGLWPSRDSVGPNEMDSAVKARNTASTTS